MDYLSDDTTIAASSSLQHKMLLDLPEFGWSDFTTPAWHEHTCTTYYSSPYRSSTTASTIVAEDPYQDCTVAKYSSHRYLKQHETARLSTVDRSTALTQPTISASSSALICDHMGTEDLSHPIRRPAVFLAAGYSVQPIQYLSDEGPTPRFGEVRQSTRLRLPIEDNLDGFAGGVFCPITSNHSPLTSVVDSLRCRPSPRHNEAADFPIDEDHSPPQAFPSTCELIIVTYGKNIASTDSGLTQNSRQSFSDDQALPPHVLPLSYSELTAGLDPEYSQTDEDDSRLALYDFTQWRRGLDLSPSLLPRLDSLPALCPSDLDITPHHPHRIRFMNDKHQDHVGSSSAFHRNQWTFEEKITLSLLKAREMHDLLVQAVENTPQTSRTRLWKSRLLNVTSRSRAVRLLRRLKRA